MGRAHFKLAMAITLTSVTVIVFALTLTQWQASTSQSVWGGTLVAAAVLLGLVLVSHIGSAREVSLAGAADRALVVWEQRYRSLVNATSDLVWTAGADGTMRDIPAWSAFTGQTAEQAAGLGWLQAVHPDERERTIGEFQRALKSQGTFRLEHRMRRHDGQYLHFTVRAVPVLEADGQVREWVGLHTDISWIKEVEYERIRLSTVVKQSADVVALAGLDGSLIFLNDAGRSMIGLGADDDIARPMFDLLMPDDVPLARDIVLPTVLKEGHWRGEVRLRHRQEH
jgi:PAS domain S-box-containing protein